ncbi:MAG: 16S rRNA (adenine(1518)-N(6)/adenine(1519)-N(6))-dimethyltransferase RsmA [Candidatus Paceibacterota bacterium]
MMNKGNKPKKSLGQHFLTSEGAVKRILEAADLKEGETVLEIGPGRGVLTKALLGAGARVLAVEKDEALAEQLKETFSEEVERGSLVIVVDDIQNANLGDTECGILNTGYSLVANIPYYITGAIIRQFLSAEHQPKKMVLLVQKEVAERIVTKGKGGGEGRHGKESLLSLSVKAYGDPKMAGTVKAGSFNPPPKVDSAILAVENISRDFFKNVREEYFFELLHRGFRQKRKQLAGNLKDRFSAETVENALSHCSINKQARAEELSLDEWKCLAIRLGQVSS